MSVDPLFVDLSLRDAMELTWPGVRPPGPKALRICIGAGAVSPADWVCIDDNPDYPDLDPFSREEVLCSGRGRVRYDAARLSEWIAPGRASVVYAHHVLEHIPVSQQRETLRAWASFLAPSGVLYLCQPDLDAVCARTLEAAQPGAAEPWFAADPHCRGLPGEEPGSRRGLPAGDLSEEMTSHFWLYLGGDHRSVPAESHVRRALDGTGIELRKARRDLRSVREDLRLFVSLEGCYVGRRTEAAS